MPRVFEIVQSILSHLTESQWTLLVGEPSGLLSTKGATEGGQLAAQCALVSTGLVYFVSTATSSVGSHVLLPPPLAGTSSLSLALILIPPH